MSKAGAVFGVRIDCDVPNWFTSKGGTTRETPTFRRADWFATVAAETNAFVARSKATPGRRLTIELLGEREPATVLATPTISTGWT